MPSKPWVSLVAIVALPLLLGVACTAEPEITRLPRMDADLVAHLATTGIKVIPANPPSASIPSPSAIQDACANPSGSKPSTYLVYVTDQDWRNASDGDPTIDQRVLVHRLAWASVCRGVQLYGSLGSSTIGDSVSLFDAHNGEFLIGFELGGDSVDRDGVGSPTATT